jgi:hypothetical protein
VNPSEKQTRIPDKSLASALKHPLSEADAEATADSDREAEADEWGEALVSDFCRSIL